MCYTIEEIQDKASPIAKSYGIKKMSLFGSYARGEATDNSDIDFFIDKGHLKSLIQYFSFINDLEDVLECHVDVVTTGIQDKAFLAHIMNEGVLIYEKRQ